MQNKYLIGGFSALALLLLVFASLSGGLSPITQTNDLSNGIKYNSMVCVYKNGELVGECSHNQFFNLGANLTRDCLRTGTCSAITNITLCNATTGSAGCGTPSAAATETFTVFAVGSGLGPDSTAGTASINTGSAGNWTITKTFTAGTGLVSQVTNVTRIGNATAYFAGNAISPSVTLSAADQLTVNWTISLS